MKDICDEEAQVETIRLIGLWAQVETIRLIGLWASSFITSITILNSQLCYSSQIDLTNQLSGLKTQVLKTYYIVERIRSFLI
jgi:hypothetical protein